MNIKWKRLLKKEGKHNWKLKKEREKNNYNPNSRKMEKIEIKLDSIKKIQRSSKRGK